MKISHLDAADVSRRDLLKLALVPGLAAAMNVAPRDVAAQQAVQMKLGSDSPGDHPYNIGLRAMKDEIERNSQGRVKVVIFPDGQIGGEEQMINGLKIGSVDGFFAAHQSFAPAVPTITVLDLPFLFRDPDQAMRVLNSPVAADLASKMQTAYECAFLGWGYLGSRNLCNKKRPIRAPEDVKGLKFRAGSKLHQEALAAMGALPTPMAFLEIFNALQTGVLDGVDTPPVDVLESKFYQGLKYATPTRHILVTAPLVVSNKFLAKLSPGDREVVRAAGKTSVAAFTQASKEQEVSALSELKKKGIQFEDSFARESFVNAVEPVYSKNADAVGGWTLIKRLKEAS